MSSLTIDQVSAKRTFHTLDGIRGVAAIFVVLLHYRAFVAPIAVHSAYLAVDLFFLLSGFVLGRAYEDRLRSASIWWFTRLRIVRLYPLYILGVLIGAMIPLPKLLAGTSETWTWATFAAASLPAFFMIPAPPIPSQLNLLFPVDYPTWSLFFEMIANIVFALLARRAGRSAFLVVCLLAVPPLIGGAWWIGSLDGGAHWQTAFVGLARVMFSFFLGVQMAHLFARTGPTRIRVPAWALLVATCALLWISPPAGFRVLYDLACVFLAFPALVWLSLGNEPVRTKGAFAALGLASYPLYIIHLPLMNLVDRLLSKALGAPLASFAPWSGVVLIAGFVLLSLLLARTYDVRARATLGSWLKVRSPKVV